MLAGEQHPQGRVVVIGGGLVGAETAEYIAQGDCEVTIVEMMGQIAAEESSTVKPFIMEDFTAHNVVVKTNTKVDRITADAVEATETLNPPAPAGRPGAPAPTPAADVPTAMARLRTSTAPWRRAIWPPPPPDTPDFVRTLMHRDSDIFHRTAE